MRAVVARNVIPFHICCFWNVISVFIVVISSGGVDHVRIL